ncbi:hypothetical protein D3C85_1108910 [compost metagenome]
MEQVGLLTEAELTECRVGQADPAGRYIQPRCLDRHILQLADVIVRFVEEVHGKACRHQILPDILPSDRGTAFLAVDFQSWVDSGVAGPTMTAEPGFFEELQLLNVFGRCRGVPVQRDAG